MFTFKHRSPYDLRRDHEFYKYGIVDCIYNNNDVIDEEAVMREIYNGSVYLFDVIDEDIQVGFVVLAESTQRYSDARILNVDFACLDCPKQGIMRLYESLPQFAEKLGFDEIAFRSTRKGWDRFCERTGFDGQTRVYFKELSNGC